MRFVPVKTAEQQAALLLHRGRERLVRQRTSPSGLCHRSNVAVAPNPILRSIDYATARLSLCDGLSLARVVLTPEALSQQFFSTEF
jgi:transposase